MTCGAAVLAPYPPRAMMARIESAGGRMTDSIEDVMPDPADAPYVSVLRCTECGATGRMYSTGEPRPEQYWDCEECGVETAEHDIIMMSDTGEQVTR